jgi:hypothetical protein
MLGLLSAILLIALIAIFTLMLIFTKPRLSKKFGNNDKKKKKSNKLHALQVKNDMADSSDCRSSTNTPETTSNAATFSSKVSRTDDEVI